MISLYTVRQGKGIRNVSLVLQILHMCIAFKLAHKGDRFWGSYLYLTNNVYNCFGFWYFYFYKYDIRRMDNGCSMLG